MSKLIIAPSFYHKNLLQKYRSEDPFSDVKIMTKEQLIGEWKGRCELKAFVYLIKKYHYSYDNAKSLIPFLPFVDETIPNLFLLKKELIEQNLIIRNDYLETFFQNKEIEIVGYYDSDVELLDLLCHFKLKYELLTNSEKDKSGAIIKYESAFDEVFYTLNEIASLIEQGTDINNIYIICNNEDYKYCLNMFSKGFGYSLDIDNSYPIYETPLAGRFIKSFIECCNIDESLELINDSKDIDLLDAIKEIVTEYRDDELSFESQLDLFIGEFKNHNYGNKHLNNAVHVITNPVFVDNAEIFVLNFAQGIYPKSYKDNQLLSDEQLERIKKNNSLNKTLNDERLWKDFFNSNNRFHFSFSNHSLSSNYFISPWAEEFGLKNQTPEFPHIVYSQDMADFYYAKAIDLKENYSEKTPEYYALKEICNIDYGKYDNQYTNVKVFTNDENIYYSYSKINTYYQCPFQFYLSRVLEIDPFEGNFATKFGTIAHAVLQKSFEAGFDFDTAYDEEMNKTDLTNEEKVFINNLRRQIKEVCDAVILHGQHMKNPRFLCEMETSYKFAPHSTLVGIIDKAIVLDDKFLAVVDYKTGNDSFDPSEMVFGCSLQLPTYCLLANNNPTLKRYSIIGTFINNLVDTSLSHDKKESELINPFHRLNGKIIGDKETISYLDDTINHGQCLFIKGVSMKQDGSFKKTNSFCVSEDLDEYRETALEKYKEADQRIRNNDFSINPLYGDKNDNACMYCQYRDICFVKASQRRYKNDVNFEESEEESDE